MSADHSILKNVDVS